MKQLKLFSALILCLFALGFTACGGGDDDENNGAGGNSNNGGGTTTQFEKTDLYGGWKYDSGDECSLYYFSDEDNTGIFVEHADREIYDRCEIIYNVNNDVTNITITEEDGDKVKYTIHLLNSEKLVLEDEEEGIIYTLKRYTGNIDEEYPEKVIHKHEAVDLGLPSGLKWACCNVGAAVPEEYGDYFAWGETAPKSTYTEENCKTYGESKQDICEEPGYDVAATNWGGKWRMPTKNDMKELISYCRWTWTTVNGVKGQKVTSKINGNSIFLPAAGYRYGSSLDDANKDGLYWSSTPNDESSTYGAYFLFLGSGRCDLDWDYRSVGLTVRPVSK